MTLAEGVPPDNVAAVTDLGDATYQHDDHHRDLAAVCDAYLEFLADSQTPYYLAAGNVNHTDPSPSANLAIWVGEASKFAGAESQSLAPSAPLGELTDPFVGPGIVDTPLDQPFGTWYTGPGAFRPLKTGVLAIQFGLVADFAAPTSPYPTLDFQLWAEDGVNQMIALTNHPNVYPAAGMGWLAGSDQTKFGGTALVTVVEADRISGASPGPSPSYYPGQIRLDYGIVPLGWDCYPVFQMTSLTGGIIDWQVDHLGIQIAKIA